MDMIRNPGLIVDKTLQRVDPSHRGPLRRGLIAIERGFLTLKEPVQYQSVHRVLRIVPRHLQNIVFVAFHANPVGGHFGLHQTVVRLQLWFFWPKLYTYCKRMVASCDGCQLANAKACPSQDLVWNFLIDAPMTVLHVDDYCVGATTSILPATRRS